MSNKNDVINDGKNTVFVPVDDAKTILKELNTKTIDFKKTESVIGTISDIVDVATTLPVCNKAMDPSIRFPKEIPIWAVEDKKQVDFSVTQLTPFVSSTNISHILCDSNGDPLGHLYKNRKIDEDFSKSPSFRHTYFPLSINGIHNLIFDQKPNIFPTVHLINFNSYFDNNRERLNVYVLDGVYYMKTFLSSTATNYLRANKCDEYSIIKIKENSVNTWDGGFLMIIFAIEMISNGKIKIGDPVEYSASHISSSKKLLYLDVSYKDTLKFTQGKMNQSIERFPSIVSHQQAIHNLIDVCKHPVDLISERSLPKTNIV